MPEAKSADVLALARLAISAGASFDVTYAPDDEVRVNIYPVGPKALSDQTETDPD